MQTDLFASKTEPSFLKEHHNELRRPPSRAQTLAKAELKEKYGEKGQSPGPEYVWVPEKGKWIHFVFARCHHYPPARRKIAKPWPESCFMNRGVPYLKFDSKKEADAWLSVTNGKAYKTWQCVFCKKWHHVAYPNDITGTTSGKSVRQWEFLIKQGKSVEEVYGITT